MSFPKYNANDRVIGSLFSEEEYDNYHISDKRYLNIALNALDGIKDIYFYVIQKSWYNDPTCINICKYARMLHPESRVIFFMDEPVEEHSYFCHRVVTENLAYLVRDMSDLKKLIQQDFQMDQENFVLKKVGKFKLRRLKKEFLSS